MASDRLDKILGKAVEPVKNDRLSSILGNTSGVTVDDAAYKTLTQPKKQNPYNIKTILSDPIQQQKITAAEKGYAMQPQTIKNTVTDPVQLQKLQFAESGLPMPTQADIDKKYAEYDAVKAERFKQPSYVVVKGDYDRKMEQIKSEITELEKLVPPTPKTSGARAATLPLAAGVQDFTSGIYSALESGANALDALIPDNFISKGLHWMYKQDQAGQRTTDQKLQEDQAGRGDAFKVYQQVGQGVGQALPNAALAIATGGASAVTQLPAASAGLTSTIRASITSMSKNPMFKLSFAQNYGNAYSDAKASGATEDEALSSAILIGLINSGIEVTGGIETLPSALRSGQSSAIREWVSSMLDEGKEEVVQGIIERLTQKVVYDEDKPLASLTDSNAVFNPATSAQEGIMGVTIAGIIGGGQAVANNAINSISQPIKTNLSSPSATEAATNKPSAPLPPVNTTIAKPATTGTPTQNVTQNATQSVTKPLVTYAPGSLGEQLTQKTNIPTDANLATQAANLATSKGVQSAEMSVDNNIKPIVADVKTEVNNMVESIIVQDAKKAPAFNDVIDQIVKASDGKPNVAEYAAALNEMFSSGKYGVNAEQKLYKTKESDFIDNRDIVDVGKRNVKPFQYQYPQVHEFFAEEARHMLVDLSQTIKGEKWAHEVDYGANSKAAETGGYIFGGTKRYTTDDIAYLLDTWRASYADIEKALNDIIKDHTHDNYALAKRIEILLDNRLSDGWKDGEGRQYPPNTDYVNAKNLLVKTQNAGNYAMSEDDWNSLISAEPPASTDDMGAAKAGLYKTNQWASKNTYPINDDKNVDLDNLPPETNAPTFDKPKKEGGFIKRWRSFYTRVVDTQHPLSVFSKAAQDRTAMYASNARNANGIVDNILNRELTDAEGNPVGKSFYEVVKQVPQNQTKDFWTYMMHRHNENRSVMGNNLIPNYNKDMSRKKIGEYEQSNPEFKQMGDDIVNWIDSFVKEWGVNTGLIDPEIYSNLRVMYPNYFPTQRIFEDIEKSVASGNVGQKFVDNASVLKKATGSDRDLNPLENIVNLVNTMVKSATFNRVGQSIYESATTKPGKVGAQVEVVAEPSDKANVVSVWKDGKKVYLKINDKTLLDSLEGIPKSTKAIPGLSQATTLYKGLITQYNVLFGVKNFLRDLPTGYAYGSEGNIFKYLAGEAKAIKEILTNGTMYKRYRAVGGGMSNYFTKESIGKYAFGITQRQSGIKKVANKIGGAVSAFNNAIETSTRLNEFTTVFNKTGDVQKALDAANTVTVNFARGGDITKTIDKNGVAYLNASVQGLDKFIRSFRSPRAAVTMLTRAGLVSTLPSLIFYLINRLNPHYDDEDNRTKDAYYLIPNYSGPVDEDGYPETFIKIPRSRELGVTFGALFERIFRWADGESSDSAFKGIGTSIKTNFSPVDPFSSNMFSPATYNLNANKDFAGRTIVPQTLQKLSPHLQYDEKTSELSKFIADAAYKALGKEWSPKAMDYLIDSYTGIIGDILLPATTKGTQTALSAFERAFTSDSVYSNQMLTNFYDNMDKAAAAAADKNLLDDVDSDVVTFEEKVSNAYVKANTEMSVLSKISARAGVGALTDDDVDVLKAYGLNPDTKPIELQREIKKVQVGIASDTIMLADGKDEMRLDINNNSNIAKAVENYSSAGISKDEAYRLYNDIKALKPLPGEKSVSTYQKAQAVFAQKYTQGETAKVLGTFFTSRDEDGNITTESILPYLSASSKLISLYRTSKDQSVVSMQVPVSFSIDGTTYKLTASEKRTFRQEYVKYFNENYSDGYAVDDVNNLHDEAREQAKYAIYEKRNG